MNRSNRSPRSCCRPGADTKYGCCLCARTGGVLLADRQRARTDLVIRALLASLHALYRRRRERAIADLPCGTGDDGADDAHVSVGRLDDSALSGLEEVERGFRGTCAVHLLVRERVEAQLEILVRGLLRLVASLVDGGRLVVHDARARVDLVHPVPAPDHAVLPEHEREALLDEVRRRLRALVFVEPTQCLEPGLETLRLVLGADEAFREPCGAECRLQVGEGRLVPLTFAP